VFEVRADGCSFFSLVAAVLDVMIYFQDSKPGDVEDVPAPESNAPAAQEKAPEGEDARAESKAEIRPVPESLSKKLPAVV
jgi:hypothetical protein